MLAGETSVEARSFSADVATDFCRYATTLPSLLMFSTVAAVVAVVFGRAAVCGRAGRGPD